MAPTAPPVEARAAAYPDRAFKGTVSSKKSSADKAEDDVLIVDGKEIKVVSAKSPADRTAFAVAAAAAVVGSSPGAGSSTMPSTRLSLRAWAWAWRVALAPASASVVLTPASPLPARLTLTLTLCGTAAFGQALRARFAV